MPIKYQDFHTNVMWRLYNGRILPILEMEESTLSCGFSLEAVYIRIYSEIYILFTLITITK